MFASKDLTAGQLNAIVKKLGGHDAALRFLRNELKVVGVNTAVSTGATPLVTWREEDSVVYFTVTSDGTTGEAWITRLEERGFRLTKYSKDVLRSPDFNPTTGVVYDIAVLKGALFTGTDRVSKNIRAEAKHRVFVTPHPEVACLIRNAFSDEDLMAMGLLCLVTMHEPIVDSAGDLNLLDADRNDGGSWLDADSDGPVRRWYRSGGFAFVVPQVSA